MGNRKKHRNIEPEPVKETKLDIFIRKNLLAGGTISYKQAGLVYSHAMVIVQGISLGLILLLGSGFGISLINVLFLLLDWYFLSKQGIKGPWKFAGLLAIPVYQWYRSKRTNKDRKWPIASTIIYMIKMILIVFIYFALTMYA